MKMKCENGRIIHIEKYEKLFQLMRTMKILKLGMNFHFPEFEWKIGGERFNITKLFIIDSGN